ncbi:MAG: hypothetical protein IJC43_05505 [Clostridia bacterium]|nr:hypothetical protein [Clostridia bacterium]
MYGDLYLTRLMWEEKSLFPDSWVFGNQFYVLTTPVLAALIYGICGSINLSMALATTVMTVLILLSFWWMLAPFAEPRRILVGEALMVAGTIGPSIVDTIEGQLFYLMASYYAGYLIILFLVFGVYLRLMTREDAGIVLPMFCLAASFATGMQSLRQTAIMVIPLCGFELLRLIGWLRVNKTFPDLDNWGCSLFAVSCTVANLMGCLVIFLVDPPNISIYGTLTFRPLRDILPSALHAFRALRSITGLRYLLEGKWVFGLMAVGMILLVWRVGRHCSRYSQFDREALPALYCLLFLSVLTILLIGTFMDINLRSIYLFPWYPLLAVSGVMISKEAGGRGALALFLLMGTNLYCSYFSCVEQVINKDPWYLDEHVEMVLDSGCDILYGSWYYVCPIAAATDGEVVAGAWYTEMCGILGYINPQDIYSERDNKKALYLVSYGESDLFLEHADRMGAKLTMVDKTKTGSFALYRSDIQLMYETQGPTEGPLS